MHKKASVSKLTLIVLLGLLLLAVAPGAGLLAQDDATGEGDPFQEVQQETTEEPTEAISEDPTPAPDPIEEPAEDPTPEPVEEPVEEVTEEAPTETPIEEPTEEPVDTPAPPEDMFSDDFQTGLSPAWLLSEGWLLAESDGNFYLTSSTPGAAAGIAGLDWPSFLFAARVRLAAESALLVNFRDGLSLRVADSGQVSLLANGQVVVGNTLGSGQPDSWRLLNIQVLGNTVTVALDRILQFSHTDPALAGQGFLSISLETGAVAFDDVVINRLDDVAPPPPDDETEAEPSPTPLPDLTPEQQALLDMVRAQGRVPVIVGFGASSRLRDDPGDAEAETYLRSLQQTRQSILSQLSRARSTARVTSDSMNWLVPYVSLEVDEAGLLALFTMPGITSLTEDGTFELYLSQSTLVIDADYAWNWGYTGRGYSVAVLDTGVDRRHNFLVNRVVAEACFSRNFCPNGRTTQTGTGASSPHICANTYGYYGDCSHGTHVAGIAAGRLASGLRGVAPEARIVGIQVFSIGGARPTAYWSDIVSGLNYVFSRRNTNKIAAANMSLGGGGFSSTCNSLVPALTSIIVQLRNAGVPTVISSGNDGYTNMIGAPSCISSAVSVGSTTKSDAISSFSNRAPFMTLFAPGSAIYSSTYGNTYQSWNGTSMAAPHVAGAFAVVRQAFPRATVDQMVNAMRSSGLPITISGGSVPRINLFSTLWTMGYNIMVPGQVRLYALPNRSYTNNNRPWFDWYTAPWATRYELVLDDNSNFSSPEGTYSGSTNFWRPPAALPDGRYFWRVRAWNDGVPGRWSPVWLVEIDTIPPGPANPLRPLLGSMQTVLRPTLRWQRGADGGFEYRLQVATNDTFSSPLVNEVSRRLSYRPPAEWRQGLYFWRVLSIDRAGNMSPYTSSSFIVNIARSPRHEMVIRSASPNRVNFAWTRALGAVGYRLEVSTSPTFSTLEGFYETDRTSWRLSLEDALPPGTYYWRVRVNYGAGYETLPAAVRNTLTIVAP